MSDTSKKLHTSIINDDILDRIVRNAFLYGHGCFDVCFDEAHRDHCLNRAILNARATVAREERKVGMKLKTQKRVMFLKRQIHDQRRWIERCEQNGVSYADGERGITIRQADEVALKDFEDELKMITAGQTVRTAGPVELNRISSEVDAI